MGWPVGLEGRCRDHDTIKLSMEIKSFGGGAWGKFDIRKTPWKWKEDYNKTGKPGQLKALKIKVMMAFAGIDSIEKEPWEDSTQNGDEQKTAHRMTPKKTQHLQPMLKKGRKNKQYPKKPQQKTPNWPQKQTP